MQVPSFMKPLTGDALFACLKDAFEDDAAFIHSIRLEQFEEALTRSEPKEFDPEIGMEFKHSGLVPYRRTNDNEELRDQFECAREVIPELAQMFAAQKLTPEFFRLWGVFRYACGFLYACYFSRGDDLGPMRSGIRGAAAKSREPQRRWVSRLLMIPLQQGRDHQRAERDVAKGINNFITVGIYPKGFEPGWFQCILGADKQLRSTYSRSHLKREEVEALAAKPGDDLPPLIAVPKTTLGSGKPSW